MFDWLRHDYACARDEALDTSLAEAFACVTASRLRNGDKLDGPDYMERDLLDSLSGEKISGP